MGDLNAAEVQKVLIEYVDKTSHNSFEEGTALYNQVGKADTDPTNEIGIRKNIYVEPNASEGWIAEGGDYPAGDAEVSVNLTIKYKNVYKVGNLTLHAKMQQNANAFLDPIKTSVKRAITGLKKIINGHMFLNGSGAIAVVSANYSGGTPTVLTCGASRGTFGVQKLKKRKPVQVYDATGTTQRVGTVGAGALTVASTNKSSRTVTATSNWPSDVIDTDIIVPANSVNNVMKGLDFIVSDAGQYFGQSRSVYDGLKSTVEDLNGAIPTISVMDKVFNIMVFKIGTEMDESTVNDLELWWSPAQRQQHRNQGFELKQFNGGKNETLELGFPRKNETVSGHITNVDVDCQHNRIYYLRHKKLKIAQLSAPKVMDLGTGLLIPMTAASGQGYATKFQFHLGAFMEFFSDEPYCLGVLDDLDVTGLPDGNR